MKDKVFTKKYSSWIKQSKMKDLTGNQAKFASFLLNHSNEIPKIGEIEEIALDVISYLKKNNI